MPIQYSINVKNRVVVTAITGVISKRDLIRFFRDLRHHPEFDSTFNQFAEVNAGASSNLSFADLWDAKSFDPFSTTSLRAVVVHTDVDYGVARMYEMVHGGQIQLFRSVSEAMLFLQLPAGF